jgi:hypothetical protein
MLSPQYDRLLTLLREAGYDLDAGRSYALAAVVGLVAQVTADTGLRVSFARQMAKPVPGTKRARISDSGSAAQSLNRREKPLSSSYTRDGTASGTVNLADMAQAV